MSIQAQTCPGWAIWALSDDGSTDGTLGLLKTCQAGWQEGRLSIRAGPGRGFSANFLSLACDTAIDADYFAYCDQDDLWDPDKLDTAIAWLAPIPADIPALYLSRTRLIDGANLVIGHSPLFPRPPSFENALVQNIGGGNTMVFNRAARSLVAEAGADVDVPLHDWWTYLLVAGCGGKVFYDAVPKIGYRQHGRNLVGSNASWRGRFQRLASMLKGEFRARNERHIAALARVRHHLSPRSNHALEEFSAARSAWLMPRILKAKRSGVHCQTRVANLALAVAVLLKRI